MGDSENNNKKLVSLTQPRLSGSKATVLRWEWSRKALGEGGLRIADISAKVFEVFNTVLFALNALCTLKLVHI